MPLAGATDLRSHRTADGSLTLRSERFNEQYHSVHGAVRESTHVFMHAGLNEAMAARGPNDRLAVLEVGLGTGLNMLLTWIRCLEGKCRVDYTALEPQPLTTDRLIELAYWDELAWPYLKEPFLAMMNAEGVHRPGAEFSFQRLGRRVQDVRDEEHYDLILFDAFGPRTQPEMWTLEVFRNMAAALVRGGILVTYCAKGEVRRNMLAAGLQVERLPGPPGKREMLRARRMA